jgi:hypothetical protein
MKRWTLLTVAAALAVTAALSAQEKPNFSGTWTLDASRSDAPPAGRGGGGGRGLAALGMSPDAPVVITQKETEITIGPATYKLDGSPSTIAGGRGGSAQATAKWDGGKLVIETSRDMRGNTIKTKEIRSLDSSGKEMRVELTISAPQGEQTRKLLFTKTG